MILPEKTDDLPDIELSHDDVDEPEYETPTDALVVVTTARDGRYGKIVGGRYRIQDRLGKGGMASVYRAVDRLNGSEYAVKILDPRFARDPSMARRCQREARAMADLANKHIPCAFVVGTTDDGETYIVMEFLRGRDLEEMIAADPPLPWRRAFHITLQLCSALEAAHARNIIHRDVKPSNCFLLQTDESGADLVKLIDFGIAKDLEARGDPTGTGMILGTPGYLAPELATGESAPSALTDVYALGVTLYKLLTHRLPWQGRSHVDMVVSQRNDAPHPIGEGMATANRRMPRDAEVVVMTAFAFAPQQRYASARAFAAALRTVLRAYPESIRDDEEEEAEAGADIASTEGSADVLSPETDASPGEASIAADPADGPPTVQPTRRVEEPGRRSSRRPLLLLAAAMIGFVGILFAVPAAPARPLAPSPLRPLVHAPAPEPSREPVVVQRPRVVSEPTSTLTVPTASPPTRPFRTAAIRKEVEGEEAFLLGTCAAQAPGRRLLYFTLNIDPAGRLLSVEATPKRFASCVLKLWREARFASSDTGGSYLHRLVVQRPLPAPPLLKP